MVPAIGADQTPGQAAASSFCFLKSTTMPHGFIQVGNVALK